MTCLRDFLSEERGGPTIDFVMVLLPVLMFIFTIIDFTLAFHMTSNAQKAAQLGARLAAVADPVHTLVPATNELNPTNGQLGDACYQAAGDACLTPATLIWDCDGASLAAACDSDAFALIHNRVQDLYPLVDRARIRITYRYMRLGTAGGPFVPLVSVTIKERPSPVQMLTFVGLLDLRAVTASALGEDLVS